MPAAQQQQQEPNHLNLAQASALCIALRGMGLGDIAAEIERSISRSPRAEVIR